KIVGVISEKDILHGMFPKFHEIMENASPPDFEAMERDYTSIVNLRVSNLMSPNVFTVGPDIPVLKAASIMFTKRIRRIPVSENGKLLGIVSVGDVHKAIFRMNLTKTA
ncbi:MAG: CBS domain-containing protein, partial [Gammaproteobacteria bacterium]|nr:CBS domain-containing protein [Gammaproteobacteria bacterium]